MHAPKSKENCYDSKNTVIELIFSHQQLYDFFVLRYKHMPTSSRLQIVQMQIPESKGIISAGIQISL